MIVIVNYSTDEDYVEAAPWNEVRRAEKQRGRRQRAVC